MESYFHLLPIFIVLFVGHGVSSHATSSSEEYWKKMLPNTPMPKIIEDSLKPESGTGVQVGSNGVDVNVGKPGKGPANVHVGKGGTSVDVGPKRKHASVDVHQQGPPAFQYQYAATKTQVQDNQSVALFFQEKDLKLGTHMNLHFTKTSNGAPLLPRKVAKSIPFSSNKLPEVLSRFHVETDSKQAQDMKETIKECEAKGIEGEDKYCATSLESMVDYATNKLGKKLDTVSTYVEKESKMQKYDFTGVKKVPCKGAIICHKMFFACGVYYCHKTETTRPYMVTLVGADGTKVKAAAICHVDTSKWNPKHLAFQVLKIEPGTVPVCHFLPEDHIVWVSK